MKGANQLTINCLATIIYQMSLHYNLSRLLKLSMTEVTQTSNNCGEKGGVEEVFRTLRPEIFNAQVHRRNERE